MCDTYVLNDKHIRTRTNTSGHMCLTNLHHAHVAAESDWPHSRGLAIWPHKGSPAGPGPWEGSEAQPIILGPRKASNRAPCHDTMSHRPCTAQVARVETASDKRIWKVIIISIKFSLLSFSFHSFFLSFFFPFFLFFFFLFSSFGVLWIPGGPKLQLT